MSANPPTGETPSMFSPPTMCGPNNASLAMALPILEPRPACTPTTYQRRKRGRNFGWPVFHRRLIADVVEDHFRPVTAIVDHGDGIHEDNWRPAGDAHRPGADPKDGWELLKNGLCAILGEASRVYLVPPETIRKHDGFLDTSAKDRHPLGNAPNENDRRNDTPPTNCRRRSSPSHIAPS